MAFADYIIKIFIVRLAARLRGSCRLTVSLICLFTSFAAIVMTINLSMTIVCMNKRNITCNGSEEIKSNSSLEFMELNGTCNNVQKVIIIYFIPFVRLVHSRHV
jgi:hypothetical protein